MAEVHQQSFISKLHCSTSNGMPNAEPLSNFKADEKDLVHGILQMLQGFCSFLFYWDGGGQKFLVKSGTFSCHISQTSLNSILNKFIFCGTCLKKVELFVKKVKASRQRAPTLKAFGNSVHSWLKIAGSCFKRGNKVNFYRLPNDSYTSSADQFFIKIWVWPERLKTMHLLEFYGNFTTNSSLTRVRAVPHYSLTHQTLSALNAFHPTIGILPSGLPYRSKLSEQNSYSHSIQYSDHSCFNEIQQFVKFFRPLKITGLVSSSSYCINPQYYFSDLYGVETFGNIEGKKFGYSDHLLGCRRCFKWKMKAGRLSKAAKLGSQKGRVGVMRRGKFGAKIAEDDLSLL